MTFGHGDQITLVTQTKSGVDTLGNDVYTPTLRVVAGAFAPGGSTELVQGQDQVITQPTVYLPAGTVVAPTDRVIVKGVTYEVDGSANDWRSPFTGRQPGVEVKLKQVSG